MGPRPPLRIIGGAIGPHGPPPPPPPTPLYGNQYLKFRLLEYYGDSIVVAEVAGFHDIVTFRRNTSQILHDYFNKPNMDDEEDHKTAIIEAAAKFIKSNIKGIVASLNNEYPKVTDMKSESAIRYLPPSLHCLLQNLFV